MYALRGINNMYSEHAGHRSDFIIIGHPEFQNGKIRSATRGMPPAWDDRGIPSRPARNIARSRSTCALVGQLTATEQRGSLKERALERTRSARRPHPGGAKMLGEDFDAFIVELMSPAEERRILGDKAASLGWSGVCRNFCALDQEMGALRAKMSVDPSGTRTHLQNTGAWKYYAQHLEQAKRMQAQLRRDQEAKRSTW
mmetsp:Transcript_5037/g.14296  ORF Transcript_5037/g.14296 Transcript_5037/m.14296 type:complete len:199 (+) Transcript_5037:122-718(+)